MSNELGFESISLLHCPRKCYSLETKHRKRIRERERERERESLFTRMTKAFQFF